MVINLSNFPNFLNQVGASRPAHAWFLKIADRQYVCVCVFVCLSALKAINN